MASAKAIRAKCTLSDTQCEQILKDTVDTLENKHYMTDDAESVVSAYKGFLAACAAKTPRLTKCTVSHAAKVVFNESKKVCDSFGSSMVNALSYCRYKGKSCTTGEKLSKDVYKVYKSFADKADDEEPIFLSKKTVDSSALSDPAGDEDLFADAPPLPAQSGDSPRRKIYALYGLAPPSAAKMTASTEEPIEVISSQEIAGSQEATATTAAPSTLGAQKRVSGGSLLLFLFQNLFAYPWRLLCRRRIWAGGASSR